MKYAVYTGTRNLYGGMTTAAKSLIANSSVDRVFFLIEDREFPEELPDLIETIDVSKQTIFPSWSINANTPFTYMAMIRVCYTKFLPAEVDKILQLDVDTICVDNVDAVWDTDLGDGWAAMVEEKLSRYKPYGPYYCNAGVTLLDLDKIRETHADDKMIRFLNEQRAQYIDQDAMNMFTKIAPMELRFNECFVTGYSEEPAIVHYAGVKDWQTSTRCPRREYIKKYREMTWDEVLKNHKKKTRKK